VSVAWVVYTRHGKEDVWSADVLDRETKEWIGTVAPGPLEQVKGKAARLLDLSSLYQAMPSLLEDFVCDEEESETT
jgi:hypothetical protein